MMIPQFLGTLQEVDPFGSDPTRVTSAYKKWPKNYPKESPKASDSVTLPKGELVLVVWQADDSYLVEVLTRFGFLFMSATQFKVPGWDGDKELETF